MRRVETTKMSDTNYSLVLEMNQLLRQKGTYDLTDLRKILDHKCQYPPDVLVKQEDFHFVPKSNGPLNPSLALCVGRMTVGTYQTESPDLYIMDVSDSKNSPPDLHCRADIYMNDELGGLRDLDRYARRYRATGNEFWTWKHHSVRSLLGHFRGRISVRSNDLRVP